MLGLVERGGQGAGSSHEIEAFRWVLSRLSKDWSGLKVFSPQESSKILTQDWNTIIHYTAAKLVFIYLTHRIIDDRMEKYGSLFIFISK